MTKIAEVIRFYNLDEIMDFIEEGGEYPLHHVWCYDKIKESGIPVECIKYDENSKWNKLGKKVKLVNLQQQINLLKNSKEYDLIFAPFISDIFLIAFLKSIGLYKKPVFGLAFEAYVPFKTHFLKRLRQKLIRYVFVNGVDSLHFIFENLYNKSNSYSKLPAKHDYSNKWGADLDFFESFLKRQTQPPTLDFIHSTGGTDRDYNTLIEAFKDIDFKLKITTKNPLDPKLMDGITPNIEIDNSVTPGLYSVGRIRQEYYNALAVAIPTLNKADYWPVGSTVLVEALAMGKPVISTRNKMYPFSLEKEKVGFDVDYADVDGWKQCAKYLIEHPDEAREMGERGKYLCEKKYNYKIFSEEVIKRIENMLSPQTARKMQSAKVSALS